MSLPEGQRAPEYYAGIGYDVHPLMAGRKLILGGVDIPYSKGLKGHSDADVLVHAVMDAILGAAGQGDIGEHFPNSSLKYKGASSLLLLKQVAGVASTAGFSIVNVDVMLLAEAPKIARFKTQMCANIASALNINMSRVNVKATTSEGLGFVGARQGMAAYATVSLRKG